jgi:hypothetical protein
MAYPYGNYVSPWSVIGISLGNIGQLLAQKQLRDEAYKRQQEQQYLSDLSKPGAMTFDEAVARGLPIENLDVLANADVRSAMPRFATPEATEIPIPGTTRGSIPMPTGTGGMVQAPLGPKTVEYQPQAPVVLPSGVVQTDVGPLDAIGKLIFQKQVENALTPATFQTPEKYSGDWWRNFIQELRLRQVYGSRGGGAAPEAEFPSQAAAYRFLLANWNEVSDPVSGQRRIETPWGNLVGADEVWDYAGLLAQSEYAGTPFQVAPGVELPYGPSTPIGPPTPTAADRALVAARHAAQKPEPTAAPAAVTPSADTTAATTGAVPLGLNIEAAQRGASELAKEAASVPGKAQMTSPADSWEVDSAVALLPLTRDWNRLNDRQKMSLILSRYPEAIGTLIAQRLGLDLDSR